MTLRVASSLLFTVVVSCSTDTPVFRSLDASVSDGALEAGSEGDAAPDGFCELGDVAWAYCEDFDGLGGSGAQAFTEGDLYWSAHDFVIENYRPDCESTHDDSSVSAAQRTCEPFFLNGELIQNAETGGYGFSHVRVVQPFDFAGREGRIHAGLNLERVGSRKLAAIFITPHLTNTLPDVRGVAELSYHASRGLVLQFNGNGLQPFSASYWENGIGTRLYAGFGPLELAERSAVDVYLTRTSVRLEIDGIEEVSETFADIGFDRAYVYFVNIAIEPRKAEIFGAEANRIRWDNLAFDGPPLSPNALIPAGEREVLFSAFAADDCTLAGMQTAGPVRPDTHWQTWQARFPSAEPAPTPADVNCMFDPRFVRPIEDFRVVDAP